MNICATIEQIIFLIGGLILSFLNYCFLQAFIPLLLPINAIYIMLISSRDRGMFLKTLFILGCVDDMICGNFIGIYPCVYYCIAAIMAKESCDKKYLLSGLLLWVIINMLVAYC